MERQALQRSGLSVYSAYLTAALQMPWESKGQCRSKLGCLRTFFPRNGHSS